MKDIFISYSPEDDGLAMDIGKYLRKNGFTHEMSTFKSSEEESDVAISEALSRCQVYMILASRQSLQSGQMEEELTVLSEKKEMPEKAVIVLLDSSLEPDKLISNYDFLPETATICQWPKKNKRKDIIECLEDLLDYELREIEEDEEDAFIKVINKVLFMDDKPIRKTIFKKKLDLSTVSVLKHQWICFGLLMVILVFGLFMLYSTTHLSSMAMIDGGWLRVKQQLCVIVMGLVLLYLCSQVSVTWWRKLAPFLFLLTTVLLLLLRSPLAVTTNGVTRWIKVFGIEIRPDEIAVWGFALLMALMTIYFRKKGNRMKFIAFTWVMAFVFAVFVLNMTGYWLHPFLILGIAFITTLVFADFVKWHYIIAGAVATCMAAYLAVVLGAGEPFSFRAQRIKAWLSPGDYAKDMGYEIVMRLDALKSGGFFGKGYCKSEYINSLPEASADNIFSIVCEELGWIAGILLVIVFILFLYQIFKIMRIALELKMYFGAAVVLGIFTNLAVRTVCSIGMSLNLLPVQSGSLPFFTYCGMSGIFFFCQLGCVFAVARECHERLKEHKGILVAKESLEN